MAFMNYGAPRSWARVVHNHEPYWGRRGTARTNGYQGARAMARQKQIKQAGAECVPPGKPRG
eukprot:1407404-Alexandrium_andersonii.AAC.1